VARWLVDGSFVNVGIGLPGLVPDHVPDERGIIFHAEHGVLGFGSERTDARCATTGHGAGGPAPEVLEFFANRYTLRPGASLVDHTTSFALVRAGLLDVTVLGAFEVAADGRFAGHRNDTMASAGVGGAPELGGCTPTVIVALQHGGADGTARLVASCRLPVGLDRRVDLVVTELGAFVPAGDRFEIVELAPGVTVEDVRAATEAPVEWSPVAGTWALPGPRRARVDRRRSKVLDVAEAVSAVADGMTVAIGGWGGCGTPEPLVTALAVSGVRDLTVIVAGTGSINTLVAAGCVRHVVTSFASYAGRNSPSAAFDELCRQGRITAELCSQGVLAERLRAGGSGLGGFWVPAAAVGSFGGDGPTTDIDGRPHVLQRALVADVSLVAATVADPFGNLSWRGGERNYNDAVARAGRHTLVAAEQLVELGALAPEQVMVPGVLVDAVCV